MNCLDCAANDQRGGQHASIFTRSRFKFSVAAVAVTTKDLVDLPPFAP